MAPILMAVDRWVVKAAMAVAMVLMALMSCVTFYQVITRFVLERPATWTEVTARSMMIWMVYLGLVAALRSGALISIDLLITSVPDRVRKVIAVLMALLTLAVLAVMFWYGWAMADRTSSQSLAGLTDPITGSSISIGLVYAAIPIGAALSIIAVIARLAEELASSGGKPEAEVVHDF